MLRHYDKLPPHLPIVFAGYENYKPEMRKKYPNLTGVTQTFDIPGTIRLGLSIYPDTQKIVILSDKTDLSQQFETNLKKSLPSFGSVSIDYLNNKDFTIKEVMGRLTFYPPIPLSSCLHGVTSQTMIIKVWNPLG